MLRLCWPAVAAALALALDAFVPFGHGAAPVLAWIDLAGLACLGWAAFTSFGHRHDWRTPVDSYVIAGFVLASLQTLASNGTADALVTFRQLAAAGGCFYALAARLRREPRAPDAVWLALAVLLVALSLCTIGLSWLAPARFPGIVRELDARWGSAHGLSRGLFLLTVLCAGRAIERGAGIAWGAVTAAGLSAFVLAGAVGHSGLGLDVAALAVLDEPFHFAMSVLAFLMIARLTRLAWQLAIDRPEEVGRWRATVIVFPLLALFLLFGGLRGGEEARLVAALAAAAVVAGRLAPAMPRVQEAPAAPSAAPAEEPLARAA